MNDKQLEKLIMSGVQSEPMVTIPGPNNTVQEVTVSQGNFFLLQQLMFQMQQVNLRLEALHQHVRVKEHPVSSGRKTCPLCQALDAKPEPEQQDANVVAGNVGAGASVQGAPDPEGDVKEDIEKAKAAEKEQETSNE